eukprot:g2793.t1
MPKVGWPVVPVVECPTGRILQDTTEIIDALEETFKTENTDRAVLPSIVSSPTQRFVSELFNFFADEWLLLPAMHYRWNKPENMEFLIHEFGNVSAGPGSSPEARRKAGEKAFKMFRMTITSGMLGVNPDTMGSLEKSYEGFLGELSLHFDQHQYILGDKPSIADFGLFAPMYAHLYRDPVPGFLMRTKAPRVADYIERMNGMQTSRVDLLEILEKFSGKDDRIAWDRSSTIRGGQWLCDDKIADTVLPILRRQFREQMIVHKGSNSALATFLKESGKKVKTLPTGIGGMGFGGEDSLSYTSTVYGVENVNLSVRPNVAWMSQRLVDLYSEISKQGKTNGIDEIIRSVSDSNEAGEENIRLFSEGKLLGGLPRLGKKDFRLIVV